MSHLFKHKGTGRLYVVKYDFKDSNQRAVNDSAGLYCTPIDGSGEVMRFTLHNTGAELISFFSYGVNELINEQFEKL